MAENSSTIKNPLVYILDDDPTVTKVIERRFITYGCEARSFENPAKFLESFSTQIPSLIVLDLQLNHDLTGLDILRTIRENNKSLPVIMLSGERDQRQIAQAIEFGANDYMIKPPTRIDFEEIITKYVSTAKLTRSASATYQTVHRDKQRAALVFTGRVERIHSAGLVILSDHLIKKGAAFHISGDELKSIFPTSEKLFVRVISTEIVTSDSGRQYRIEVEVDSQQESALQELRNFLKSIPSS